MSNQENREPAKAAASTVSSKAARLHRRCIVIDGHYDRLYPELKDAQADVDSLRVAGITCYIRQSFVDDVLPFFERTHKITEKWPEAFTIATNATHIREAIQNDRIATILSIEGVEPLHGKIEMLHLFYRIGLRNCGITWNTRNRAADGVMEAESGGGLTGYGKELVNELGRLGIMVDVAHLASAAVDDVLSQYGGPVNASHANAAALCNHPRNLSDDHIRAIAASGGLVGVTPVPKFVTKNPLDMTLDTFLDHIDYICSLAGADHIGIGTDWDGFESIPDHFMSDITDLPIVTEGLLNRGYGEEDIEKILGGNWLRVFEKIAG